MNIYHSPLNAKELEQSDLFLRETAELIATRSAAVAVLVFIAKHFL